MTRPSTRNLAALPGPVALERLCMSLAMLDAIVCPDWESRYYSFNKDWDKAKGNRMGSMRNGSGDEFYVLFTASGVALKGYAHEYPMAKWGTPPEGVLSGFPTSIEDFLSEPAFAMDCTTFCVWHLPGKDWEIGPVAFADHDDPDGSVFLLELLDGSSNSYQRFARNYYETEIPIQAIEDIYSHKPLTTEIIASINNEASITELADDIAQIGYPRLK